MKQPNQSPGRYLFYVEDDYCFGVLRPIQQALLARGDEVAWLPVDDDIDRDAFTDTELVFAHVKQAIEWQPKAVLVPGNQVPGFIPGLKVQVFHGLASAKRRKNGELYHFIYRGLFDLYCTHGPNTTERFKQIALAKADFEVAETGWAKLDPLLNGSVKVAGDDRPTVYFASTFSPRLSAAPHLLETVIELVERFDWRWLVNFHPKMDPAVVDRYRAIRSDRLEVIDTKDVMPLLMAADVMLCDTSSIVLEFSLLSKPVVTYRNQQPEPYHIDVTEPDQVGPALQRALESPEPLMKAIRQKQVETHPYTDGLSSQRTLAAIDRMVDGDTSHLKRKPLNLIRHFKMRRQLGYFWPSKFVR